MTTTNKFLDILSKVMFALTLIVAIFYTIKLVAEPNNPSANIEISHLEFDLFSKEFRLKPADEKLYTEKRDFHKKEGLRCYNEAHDKCWWLPEITERESAKCAWAAAIAQIGCPTPQSKLVSLISILLVEYGIDCIDEWKFIQNKLYWAEYHLEMYEWYDHVIKNA